MESPSCKRYIVTAMEGDEPFMTDDLAVAADAMESEWHFVIDTHTGTCYFDGQWNPIEVKEKS